MAVNETPLIGERAMIGYFGRLGVLSVILLAVIAAPAVSADSETSPVGKLIGRLPDDVLAFIATAGGDYLKPAFEKSSMGKIWHEPAVHAFVKVVIDELSAKITKEADDPHQKEAFELILPLVKQLLRRPMLIALAHKPTDGSTPLYGFLILDAGDRKDSIAAGLAKLELLAKPDKLVDVKVGPVKMRSLKNDEDPPLRWGWIGNHFVITVNDDAGLTIKNLLRTAKPSTRPARVANLEKVPGKGELVTLYIDYQKTAGIIKDLITARGDTDKIHMDVRFVKALGLDQVSAMATKVDFAGPDLVCEQLTLSPGPHRGLFAHLRPVALTDLDIVTAKAFDVAIFDCDFAGIYDTIMAALRTALPAEAITELDGHIAGFEKEVGLQIRDELLENLAGLVIAYVQPGPVIMMGLQQNAALIMKLKNPALMEKSLAAIAKYVVKKYNGSIQITSQIKDGRTVYSCVIPNLAIVQVTPCAAVVADKLVIVANIPAYDEAVKQLTAKDRKETSILTTDKFRQVTTRFPQNTIYFRYTDCQSEVENKMTGLHAFWTVMAVWLRKEENINLPIMLPPTTDIARHLGPSCSYMWFDPDGIRERSQGPLVNTTGSIQATVGVGMGAGIFLPALARARTLTKRVQSASSLRNIAKACFVHANDHQGKFPDKLKDLVDGNYLEPNDLASPSRPKSFNGPSYIYIAGQTAEADPKNILAYENPAFSREGTNVLFADGHVQWIKTDEFLKQLEATYKRLGKPMPERISNSEHRTRKVEVKKNTLN